MIAMFRNTTQYNDKLCQSYCDFHQSTSNKINYIHYSICLFVLLLGGTICYVKNLDILSIFFGMLSSIYIAYIIVNIYIESISSYHISTNISNSIFTFIFYDNSFTISSNKKFSIVPYEKLYKIRVTKDYTYLYTNKSYAFVINNSTFSKGQLQDFKKFLKKKCKFKYIELKEEQ